MTKLAKLGATPPFRKTKPEQSQENGRSPAGGPPAASAKEKGYAGADDFFDASTQKKEGFRSPASETLQSVKWRRPTLPRVCSTIGATGLNCSVRNGKRWDPGAIAASNKADIFKRRNSTGTSVILPENKLAKTPFQQIRHTAQVSGN